MDVQDIVSLRLQGMNFKEIAKNMISDHAKYQAEQIEKTDTQENELIKSFQAMGLEERQEYIYKDTQTKLLEMLEEFFPSASDAFLS